MLWIGILGLHLALFVSGQQGPGPAPLPATETPLWRNIFAVVIGQSEDEAQTKEMLEESVREQYTAAGYGISLLNVGGCSIPNVSSIDGYSPSAGPAPSAFGGPPLPAVPAAALPHPLNSALIVKAACYRMNATLYFEPSSEMFLDAAAGTSDEIADSISKQTGLSAELYLLSVVVLPSIERVMYTGDTLYRVRETGYLSTIWIAGSRMVPFSAPQVLGTLASFSLLELGSTAGVVRNRISHVEQNSTGVALTYLSVVRPNWDVAPFPEALEDLVSNGTFIAALRETGLPAEHVSLVSLVEDNSTTVGTQVSSFLADAPVISNFGTATGPPNLAEQNSAARAPATNSGSSLSGGAVAGIVVGAVIALLLLSVLGCFVVRNALAARHDAGTKLKSPMPSVMTHSSRSSLSSIQSAKLWSTTHSLRSLPIQAWSQGSWQLTPASIVICQRDDGGDVILGQGTYGVVYKAILDGQREVAVKMLSRVDSWQLHQFKREIDLLRSLPRNDNIVQFYGACLSTDCPFLVLEYMRGGDLRDALSDPRTTSLFDWHRNGWRIALDVAYGLQFLHARNIIHADLKSKNVLLTADHRHAKVADVGLSRIMHGSHASSNSDAVGTFSYAAPEQILGYKLTPKVDSFAFSVLLWEIITRDPPVRGQLYTIECPDKCPQDIAKLIEGGMNRTPSKRPSAQEAVRVLSRFAGVGDPVSRVDAREATQLNPFSIFNKNSRW